MQDGIFRKELFIFGRVWEAHLLVISGDRGWLSSLANPGASGSAGGYSLGQMLPAMDNQSIVPFKSHN